MAVFSDIVRYLTGPDHNTDIQEVSKRHTKVLQYNVLNGKKNCEIAAVSSYKMWEDPEVLHLKIERLAHIMGWCNEMLQACNLVADDYVDGLEMRRGALCWHRNPEIGMSAVNDSRLLENRIFYILKLYFSQHPCYIHALELFHDVGLKTVMEHGLDNLSHVNGEPNLSRNYTGKERLSYWKWDILFKCKMTSWIVLANVLGSSSNALQRAIFAQKEILV